MEDKLAPQGPLEVIAITDMNMIVLTPITITVAITSILIEANIVIMMLNVSIALMIAVTHEPWPQSSTSFLR